jgi:hypothetical protein
VEAVVVSVTIDHSPARLSSALGLVFGAVAVVAIIVSGTTLALFPSVFGGVAVGSGLRWRSRITLTIGAVGLLAGMVIAGLLGAQPVVLLVVTIATVLTWDSSENAITVGERLGQAAQTQRSEVVHIAATLLVTTLTTGIGYLVYLVSSASASSTALVALLLAGVLLIVGLRH